MNEREQLSQRLRAAGESDDARLAAEDLGSIAWRFTELAGQVAQRPVQLVKMIGDEAMLVSPDTLAILGAVTELVAATRRG